MTANGAERLRRTLVGLADLALLLGELPALFGTGAAAPLVLDRRDEPAPQTKEPFALLPPPAEVEEPSPTVATPLPTPAPVPLWRLEELTFTEPLPPAPARVEAVEGLNADDLSGGGRSLTAREKAPPLAPWSQLWPWLRARLQGAVRSREPDVAALVRRLSRGEPLPRIPTQRRSAWAPRARLVLDRSDRLVPFWSDYEHVRSGVEKARGKVGLEVTYLRPEHQSYAFHERGEAWDEPREDRDVPVLVLGDLGAYGAPHERRAWLKTARRLRRAGVTLSALVPCPPERLERALWRAWRAEPWESPRHRPRVPVDPKAREERAGRLLQLVAATALAHVGLLRDLRRLLPLGDADASTEADVWAHPSVLGADTTGLVLRGEAQREMRGRLAEVAAPLLEEVSRTIRRWHEGLLPSLAHAETLAWSLTAPSGTTPPGDLDAARGFLQRLSASAARELESAGAGWPPSVLRFARRLASTLPQGVHRDPLLGAPLRTIWKAAHWDVSGASVPDGLTAQELAGIGARGPVEQEQTWAVRQVGGELRLSPSGSAWASADEGPGSPVAWLIASGATLLVSRGEAGRPKQVFLRPGLRLPAPPDAPLVLSTGSCRAVLRPWLRGPERWASEAGRDRFGLWADAEIKGVVQRFRWIPPGRFRMGSPESEEGRLEREGPIHEVTWTEGRWLADTPVTQALWEAVMGSNPSRFKGGQATSPRRPVEQVSWNDVEGRFLTELAKVAPDLAARLPTEAEWEHACRGGTETATWLGDSQAPLLKQVAWYWDNSQQSTHPVAQKDPNPFGLFDMLGNVFAWCADATTWPPTYWSAAMENPAAGKLGTYRVIRGGSWSRVGRLVRAAYRDAYDPSVALDFVGLRLARSQGPVRAAEPQPRSGSSLGAGRPPGASSVSNEPAKQDRKKSGGNEPK